MILKDEEIAVYFSDMKLEKLEFCFTLNSEKFHENDLLEIKKFIVGYAPMNLVDEAIHREKINKMRR